MAKLRQGEPLSEKEKNFCEFHLSSKSSAAAYQKAGFKCSSIAVAYVSASKLLRKPKIQAYLYELRAKAAQAALAPLSETIKQLSYIVRSDISDAIDFSDSGATLKNIDELSDEVRAAIASIDISKTVGRDGAITVRQKVKLHNKVAAAQTLMAYHGCGTDLNQAIATFKRYSLKIQPDSSSELGWSIERLAD